MSQNPEQSPEENISRIYLDSKFVSEQKDVFERNYRIFRAEKFYRLRYLIAAATAGSFALAALLGLLGWKARSDYHCNQEAILARASDSEALANRYNTELIDERKEKDRIAAELEKERRESGKKGEDLAGREEQLRVSESKVTDLEGKVRSLEQQNRSLEAQLNGFGKILELEKEATALKGRYLAVISKGIDEDADISALEKIRQDALEVKARFPDTHSSAIDSLADSVSAIRSMYDSRNAAASQAADKDKEIKNLDDKIRGYESQIIELKKTITTYESRVKELEGLLMPQKDLVDRITKLQQYLKESDGKKEETEKKRIESDEKRKQSEATLVLVKQKLAEYSSKCSMDKTMQKDVEGILGDISALKASYAGDAEKTSIIAGLESVFQTVRAVVSMRDDISARYKTLEGANIEKAKLIDENAGLVKDRYRLKKDFEQAEKICRLYFDMSSYLIAAFAEGWDESAFKTKVDELRLQFKDDADVTGRIDSLQKISDAYFVLLKDKGEAVEKLKTLEEEMKSLVDNKEMLRVMSSELIAEKAELEGKLSDIEEQIKKHDQEIDNILLSGCTCIDIKQTPNSLYFLLYYYPSQENWKLRFLGKDIPKELALNQDYAGELIRSTRPDLASAGDLHKRMVEIISEQEKGESEGFEKMWVKVAPNEKSGYSPQYTLVLEFRGHSHEISIAETDIARFVKGFISSQRQK